MDGKIKARENKRRGKGRKEDGGGVRKKRTIHGGVRQAAGGGYK